MSIEHSPIREPKRRFAERWGVSTRTIDRWVRDGLLEEPEVINGRAISGQTLAREAAAPPRRRRELCPTWRNPPLATAGLGSASVRAEPRR